MREAGLTVNDRAKIHSSEPTSMDHCILFEQLKVDLTIPMRLNGTFSYFATRLPTSNELMNCDKVFCTPDASEWNPNCASFSRNEESMMDSDGNLSSEIRWLNDPMLFEKKVEHPAFDCGTINVEKLIDGNISSMMMTGSCDIHCSSIPSEAHDFAYALNTHGEISSFGCTLIDVASPRSIATDLFDNVSTIDEDAAVWSMYANKAAGPSPEDLSKLWMISEEQAKQTLSSNTQLCKRPSDNILSRNFSSNGASSLLMHWLQRAVPQQEEINMLRSLYLIRVTLLYFL